MPTNLLLYITQDKIEVINWQSLSHQFRIPAEYVKQHYDFKWPFQPGDIALLLLG